MINIQISWMIWRRKLLSDDCRLSFDGFNFFCRYTDSVMNYQPMGPGAQSFAQFYHQAALTSAASAGVGGDSLGKLCKKKKKISQLK